jgi:hypothetical protein
MSFLMHAHLPRLTLTHGQAIWTLCLGIFPVAPQRQLVLDQVRYLRQLGIPFDERTRGQGRGHRMRYHFEELAELGVALYALRRGVRPKDIRACLVTERTRLRALYHQAMEEQPAQALEACWVKSRGTSIPLLGNERFLRVHNRYSDTPGTFDVIGPEQAQAFGDLFGMRELFADGTTQVLVPLTRLVLELVAWAREAPDTKPGRRPLGLPSPTPSSVGRT